MLIFARLIKDIVKIKVPQIKEAKLSFCDFRFVFVLFSVDLDSLDPHYVSFIKTFLTNREMYLSHFQKLCDREY